MKKYGRNIPAVELTPNKLNSVKQYYALVQNL